MSVIIGNTKIGKRVFVAPFASVRGDEGQPLFIGDDSNIQDGVIIHALETEMNGSAISKHQIEVNEEKYAVFIGSRVSLAHQSQVHGPAYIGDDTFIGMKSLIFKSKIGRNCVIEPGCVVMGVNIHEKRYVPALTVVRDQDDADKLPQITDDYPLKHMNEKVTHVNMGLAAGYNKNKESIFKIKNKWNKIWILLWAKNPSLKIFSNKLID